MNSNQPGQPSVESVLLPVAQPGPPPRIGRWQVLLFIAVLAASLSALAAWRWSERGFVITVLFPDAHDLRPGCKVKCKGAEVGKVLAISLTENLHAEVTIALHAGKEALSRLASASSRFWIVHPVLTTNAIAGLDAVFTRYVAVLPGEGTIKRRFVGLPEEPVIDDEKRGRPFELRSAHTAGISPGAPVTYRGLPVGEVLSVEHLKNANGVSIKAWVSSQYLPLVCEKTEWWKTGGARFSMAFSGISAEVGSLQSLFVGGVEFATPPESDAGNCYGSSTSVEPRRFVLHPEPAEDWLAWEPHITIGSALVEQPPRVHSASLKWRAGKKEGLQQGLVLPTERGVLGPVNVLVPPEKSEGDATLTVDGQSSPWKREQIVWKTEAMALYSAVEPGSGLSATAPTLRTPNQMEDVAVFNLSSVPVLVDREHLTQKNEAWIVDSGLPFSQAKWHGAAVVSRVDSIVIGMLSVDHKDRARIIPWNPPIIEKP